MRIALGILALFAAAAPIGVQAETPPDPVALARRACIDVDLNPERLAEMARAERWGAIQATRPSGGPATDVAMYSVGQARVMLAGDANDAACAIVVDHPTGPWRDTLAGLVAEMDLRQIPSAPVEGESNSWAAPNRYALSYTLSPVGGLIVSVSRSHFSMTHEDGVEAVETSGVEATPYP